MFKAIPTKFADMDFIKIIEVNSKKEPHELSSADFIHKDLDEAIDFFESLLQDLKQQKYEEN